MSKKVLTVEFFQRCGRQGGSANTQKQIAARNENLKKARARREELRRQLKLKLK